MSVATSTAAPLGSSKQLFWDLLGGPGDLDPEAAAVITRVLQDTETAKVLNLGRRFCQIVWSRCGLKSSEQSDVTAFDEWLAKREPAASAS